MLFENRKRNQRARPREILSTKGIDMANRQIYYDDKRLAALERVAKVARQFAGRKNLRSSNPTPFTKKKDMLRDAIQELDRHPVVEYPVAPKQHVELLEELLDRAAWTIDRLAVTSNCVPSVYGIMEDITKALHDYHERRRQTR